MALRYLSTDRDQPFLLPPSVRDWLPEEHLAWFVLDVIDRVDTSALHDRHPNVGAGRAAYDPEMLLGLLVYAYCTGVRSSRQIERLCEVDVAYRVVAANRVPDHTTIARFRQDYDHHARRLFNDVLVLCAQAGLAKVGVVAIDGTKMAANASRGANRTRAQLEKVVQAIFDEAAEVDAAEDELFGDRRGDELPPELADPKTRRAALDAALRELRRQEEHPPKRGPSKQKAEARVADAEAALTRAETTKAEQRAAIEARAAAAGRKPTGPPPGEDHYVTRAKRRVEAARAKTANTPAREARVNVTDPDSRLMPTTHGFIQGYNAQAAVNEAGVVLAGDVVQDTGDVDQCEPMLAATQTNLAAAGIVEPIGVALLDAGYWSEDNVTATDPPRLIPDTKGWKLRQRPATSGPPPRAATPMDAMRYRLRTPEGVALYAKRSTTVEPVFGQHKEARRIRRFARRGLNAVKAEWQLINATHNILKLFRAHNTVA
jgi:transposase